MLGLIRLLISSKTGEKCDVRTLMTQVSTLKHVLHSNLALNVAKKEIIKTGSILCLITSNTVMLVLESQLIVICTREFLQQSVPRHGTFSMTYSSGCSDLTESMNTLRGI